VSDRPSVKQQSQARGQPVFDLGERTARFGEEVVRFCKGVPKSVVTEPLIRQLVKSGTSVGANYCEADDATSRKEFRQKIGTCKKEARESKFWFRMLAVAEPGHADQARVLWREAHELHLIFATIFRKVSTQAETYLTCFPSSLVGHWWGIRHLFVRRAERSISAASFRVVSDRLSPRSITASSSTRASSPVSGVIVVAVFFVVLVLRIVHWWAA
jgi:four helix bundle protein